MCTCMCVSEYGEKYEHHIDVYIYVGPHVYFDVSIRIFYFYYFFFFCKEFNSTSEIINNVSEKFEKHVKLSARHGKRQSYV